MKIKKAFLLEELELANAKIQYLINYFVDLPEGTFTFPDGDTWQSSKYSEAHFNGKSQGDEEQG